MRSSTERRLKLAISGLVLVSYFGLTTTFNYGRSALLVAVLGIACMPIGEWLDRRYRMYRQFTSALLLFFILMFPFILQSYQLLDSVVSLVMVIQLYSLVHVKRERNYGHIILMSFFLILAASVLTPRAGIALVYISFVLLTAWALTLLEVYSSEMSSSGHATRIRDRNGRDLALGKKRTLDLRFSSALPLAALVILAITGVLFVLTPRTEAGLFGATDDPAQFTTGLSKELDLTLGGMLGSSSTTVMRVQFPKEPGGVYNGALLWRSTALDSYTGTKWVRRGLISRGNTLNVPMRRLRSDPRLVSNDGLDRPSFELGREVYQEVYLDGPAETGLPALQMVKMIVPEDTSSKLRFRWDAMGDFTVNMSRSAESVVSLRVWSEVVDPAPDLLREMSQDYRAVMMPMDIRNLTEQDLLPETLALVAELTEDEQNPYDRIMALHDWLRFDGGYAYSTEIPFLPEQNPLDAFILREKSGHCELYASALALMVRSLGIPARVVSGYRGGRWNENDQSYTITNDMAHLWTEAYFPDVGWVSFDASPPADTPSGFSLDSLVRTYSRYMLQARIFWLRNVVSYVPTGRRVSFGAAARSLFRIVAPNWAMSSSNQDEASPLEWVRIPLMVSVFAVAVYLFARVLLGKGPRSRTFRTELTEDQKRAVKLRGALNRKLRRLGVDCEGLTAEEIVGAIGGLALEDSGSALYVVDVYSASRFGQRSLPQTTLRDLFSRVRGLRLLHE